MRRGDSFYGRGLIDRAVPRSRICTGRARRRRTAIALALAGALVFLSVFAISTVRRENRAANSLSTETLPLVLALQHHDTVMVCTACNGALPPLPAGPHAWNDAKGLDGVYGTPDDCPHCSAYCAPASISMITVYRGIAAPASNQDNIYDAGKTMNGETVSNGITETHGVGMFHGVGGSAPEVQLAMTTTLGGAITQHNQSDATALTSVQLKAYIHNSRPVLWLDHGGWPQNQSALFPPGSYRQDQGHAKVIGGYDDNDSVGPLDDLCLVFDPWPEYLDRSILPLNATKGPGGSFDPYWLPLKDVNLSDLADVYLVDKFPAVAIGEFPTGLLPVLATTVIILAAVTRRRIE